MKKITLILTLISFSAQAANCIAHRGNNHLFLENSMRAVVSSVEVESDGVEFDVQHTKDGFPILMHDKKLKRTADSKEGMNCPLNVKIKKLTLKDIQENCKLKNGEEIPLLRDILSFLETKDLFIFIELKDRPTSRTFELIETFMNNNPNRVRVISFKYKFLKLVKKLSNVSDFWKEIKTLWVTKLVGRSWRSNGADVNHFFRFNLWIQRLMGKETAVWTVDKEKRLKKLLKSKVDFITTNNPKHCMDLKDQL